MRGKHDVALDRRTGLLRRHLYFLFFFVVGGGVVFWTALKSLIDFAQTFDYGSHIVLVVPVSAFLIYSRSRVIFSHAQFDFFPGSIGLLAVAILAWAAHFYPLLGRDSLSVEILALVVLWLSGFLLCYGLHAFRAARFPLLFLLLLVPFPEFLVEKVIFFLQAGSTTVALWLLRVLQVPVFREGFILRLPGLDLEVAKQCSGIRSSLALLITTLLVSDLVLHSVWKKSLLVSSILPILILKNGIRIVTLSLLAIYVDRGFLHGWLHTSGGVVFYLLGVLALIPIAIMLRTCEARSAKTSIETSALSDTSDSNMEV